MNELHDKMLLWFHYLDEFDELNSISYSEYMKIIQYCYDNQYLNKDLQGLDYLTDKGVKYVAELIAGREAI